MLTIAPARCRRMIGSTCLHAMIVPRRLMAETRSNASSVSSSIGFSPPPPLTPTLLCRMSMRPQRAPAPDADADIVVQDVDAAPTAHRLRHQGGKRRLARHIGLKRDALAAFLRRQ